MFVPAQRNPPVPLGSSLRSQQNASLPVPSTRPLHTAPSAVTFNEIGVALPSKAIMPNSLNRFVDQRVTATLLQQSGGGAGGRSSSALLRVGQTTINPKAPFQVDRFDIDTRYIPTTTQEPKQAAQVGDALIKMLTPSELATTVDSVIEHTSDHVAQGRYHALEEAHFRNFAVRAPHVKEVPITVPKELIDKANKEVFCLTPSERRQIAAYEKQQHILLHERKREVRQRMALVDAMRKAYPQGIADFDTPALPDSLVYADSSAKLHANMAASQRHAEGRHNAIGQRFNSDEHFAPPPLDPAEPPARFLQAKVRAYGCPSALEDSHERLFMRSQQMPKVDPERAQRLRNLTTKGKSYDIITGVEIQVMPPTIPEHKERFKGHESLTYHSKYR